MEPGLWIGYWYQVFVACLNWIIELYPIPTVIIGVLITGATVTGFMFIGKRDEARNIVLAFAFGLAACCVTFAGLVIVWGPYLHLQQREKELTDAAKIEYGTMETSKNNQIKTLNDTVVALQEGQAVLQGVIQGLEKEKPSVLHERDRLCENKVAYKLTPQPLPGRPFGQLITISKPRTPLYEIRIISNTRIFIDLHDAITGSGGGSLTSDYMEPISEISFRDGIKDEYTFPIHAEAPFSIKCVARVS